MRWQPPPVLDPFCGGGSIPLEAQRLGLEAHASDLNPVAVLITKALIEIPPKFAGSPPVHPVGAQHAAPLLQHEWRGAQGLADDVRYYGQWMRNEAEKRIGHLYPKVKLPPSIPSPLMGEGKGEGVKTATVIAWLWARTVKCPNPACGAMMPLVRSFWLSTKKGKKAWVEPVVDKQAKTVRFEVKTGEGIPQEGTVSRQGAHCIVCSSPVPFDHVRIEGRAGRMGARLMAIVAEGKRERIYLPPVQEHEAIAAQAKPKDVLETGLPEQALGLRVQLYGMTKHRDLFTPRQLVALTTFSDLVGEARERVLADAREVGTLDDGKGLNNGGTGAKAYADAVTTYLALAASKSAHYWSNLCIWRSDPKNLGIGHVFARQAIQMVWDYAEANPISESSGNWMNNMEWTARVVDGMALVAAGKAKQFDATAAINGVIPPLISTDPPYYDNVPYADLSDFFYVWLRRSLGNIYPDLFSTLLVPKAQELVADPHRHGGRNNAQQFFEEGLGKAFTRMCEVQHPVYPLAVYYAFKQAEDDDDDDGSAGVPPACEEGRQGGQDGRAPRNASKYASRASTGWETMLEGLLKAGFTITGTWPMRSELSNRPRATGSNALASSIVLVCRPRPEDARPATRREFLTALNRELPDALKMLQHGNIAPVDLAQAAIGPGMAVFSRYAKVLEADGTPMRVRTALALINQTLDEVLAEQEGEFDTDTRWAVAWFEQCGFDEGPFGVAETLSKAKNTAVAGMVEAGILAAKAGKVRLLRRDELPADWDPTEDGRLTVWETTQHLIRVLEKEGESGAARLLAKLGSMGELARDLAYRLYTTCERKKWAQEALAFNSLVVSWPEVVKLAGQKPEQRQEEMF